MKTMNGSIKVLVCDGLDKIRLAVRQIFEQASGFCVVDEAVGGEAAVSKAVRLKPDLVLMDVSMSDMEGVEATRRILVGVPEVKVLAFSSDATWEAVDRMFLAGAAGYVVKGPDLAELLHAARLTMAGGHYLSRGILESASVED